MLKQILVAISLLISAIFVAFRAGKKSVKIKENEIAAEQIQARNEIIDNVRKLDANERAKLVRKFTKRK